NLLSLCLGSVAVVAGAALVQVSFGTYSMTLLEAWGAVFSPDVLLSGDAWRSFLLGAEMPDVSTRETVVWNIRLPRVLLAVLVGANL
ncbi:MAG: iron ABC transporter permease, partial [Halobaculum sp.]